MKMKRMGAAFGAAFLAGCASDYVPAPLPLNHPANSQAQLAAFSPPPNPFKKILSPQATTAQAQAEGEGKVIAVIPGSDQIVVEHGEIKGFMGPMTMGYKVSPPNLIEGLKAGDKIRFTIDKEKKVIVKIVKEGK